MIDHLLGDCGWDLDRHRIAISLQEHHVRRWVFFASINKSLDGFPS
jgi:hypothetical protein